MWPSGGNGGGGNELPSPRGATTDCGDGHLIAALSTKKGWKAELAWLADGVTRDE